MTETATRFQRPTRMNGDIYIAFVNKCRMDGKQIRDELEKVIDFYNKNGEAIFLSKNVKKK
jgi:hypothetical protein